MVLCFSAMVAPVAVAQQSMSWDDYYVGGQVSKVDIDSVGKPTALSIIVGEQVHPNFSVEGRLGFSVAADSVSYQMNGSTIEEDVEFDYAVSLLAKPQANLSDTFSVYALAGWSRAEVSISQGSSADSGLSFGAGLSLRTSPEVSVYLDWLRLMDEDDVDFSSINLGVSYHF